MALRDGLTGLFNHRYFQESLEAELGRARRQEEALGPLFIDVDHFKQYNDRNGHTAGDRLLKRLSAVLVGGKDSALPRMARISDVIARYGGEEFVMILPATDGVGCLARAERLLYPLHADDEPSLIAAADAMLYRTKNEARNRVCVT